MRSQELFKFTVLDRISTLTCLLNLFVYSFTFCSCRGCRSHLYRYHLTVYYTNFSIEGQNKSSAVESHSPSCN